MAATRLPGKPLLTLGGRPLVQWVYEAAMATGVLDDVVVATPDVEIAAVVESIGGSVVMTSDRHPTGTDRVAEVAMGAPDYDVVANIQGDQPFVHADAVRALIEPFSSSSPPLMTTLGAPLDPRRLDDPSAVKVVCDLRGDALYFTRAAVPYMRTEGPAPVFHHVGLYAFTRSFLLEVAAMEPTPLEQREGLEQLRVLEHGYRIRVGATEGTMVEINTPDDVLAAEAYLDRR